MKKLKRNSHTQNFSKRLNGWQKEIYWLYRREGARSVYVYIKMMPLADWLTDLNEKKTPQKSRRKFNFYLLLFPISISASSYYIRCVNAFDSDSFTLFFRCKWGEATLMCSSRTTNMDCRINRASLWTEIVCESVKERKRTERIVTRRLRSWSSAALRHRVRWKYHSSLLLWCDAMVARTHNRSNQPTVSNAQTANNTAATAAAWESEDAFGCRFALVLLTFLCLEHQILEVRMLSSSSRCCFVCSCCWFNVCACIFYVECCSSHMGSSKDWASLSLSRSVPFKMLYV